MKPKKTKTSTPKTKTKKTSSSKTRKTSKTSSSGKTKKSKTGKTKKRIRPPSGFKPIHSSPSEAKQTIENRLRSTKEGADLGGRVYVHQYADGTVDGELVVSVPRGTKTEDVLKNLRDAFETHPGGLGHEYWLSIGERYVIKEDDEVYRRHKGMNEISMYYTRVRTANIISAFGAARTKMTRGAEKKFHRKAETVFVRLHWNPDNAKPRR